MKDSFIQAVISGDLRAVSDALREGRDPNQSDEYGWIALHRAAVNNTVEVARLLIASGSSLKARGTDGWTPLHLAAVSGSAGVAAALVEAGAEIDAISLHGDTPLHLCVISQSIETARILLLAGASLHIENRKGASPLSKAELGGPPGILDLLREWESENTSHS